MTHGPRELELARELERRDDELAAALAELAELGAAVEGVRATAAAHAAVLTELPEARARGEAARDEALREVEQRRRELEVAEAALARAGREEEAAAARRAVVRTRDALSGAERRLARAEEARAEVEEAGARAETEASGLEARAVELTGRLRSLPRLAPSGVDNPDAGLGGLVRWAERAASALFVARGGLQTERDRVVREANELGASVFGEPLFATSVALVRRRIEQS